MANTRIALDFFQQQGWSPAQAAGIVGNLMQESGPSLNTSAVGDGGAAFGIAQHNGPRKRALFNFARMRGKDPSDLQVQLEFIAHELNTTEKAAAGALRRAGTAAEAARVFSEKFERPGIPHLERRVRFAEQLAGGQVSNAPAPPGNDQISALAGADSLVGDSGQDQLDADVLEAIKALQNSEHSLDPDVQSALQNMDAPEGNLLERAGAALADQGRQFIEATNESLTGAVNEFQAGLQGVNPREVHNNSEEFVGVMVQGGLMGEPSVQVQSDRFFGEFGPVNEVDYSRVPLSSFPSSEYFTRLGPNGETQVFRKSDRVREDSPLLNAGRVLGLGASSTIPLGAKADSVRRATGPAAQAAQAAQRIDVTPSLGAHGTVPGMVASTAESSMVTGSPIRRDIMRASSEMQGARDRIANSAGEALDPVSAGDALRSGAENFVTRQIRGSGSRPSVSQKLLEVVEQRVPVTTQIQVGETVGNLKAIVGRFENLPQVSSDLGLSQWKRWIEDIEANGGILTWQQARMLRSQIGAQVGKISGPLANRAQGELKQVYGALSDDLAKAAEAAGPDALAAWQRYNKHYERTRTLIDRSLDFVLRNDTHPEKAYEKFLRLGWGKGQQANLRQLTEIKRALPADAWGEVLSVVIRRMGQNGDDFSPAKFVTDWGRLSDQAKAVLFTGKKVPRGLRQELNDLVTVAESSKAAEKLINHSRSGAVAVNAATGGAIVGATMAGDTITGALAALGLLSARGLAEAFASPTFVKGFRNYVASGGTPGAARSLANIVKQDPKLAVILSESNLVRTSAEQSQSQSPTSGR